MRRVIHVNTVIAHHHVFHGYGQWLSNDPRGSGSTTIRQKKFEDLGPIHHGRKRVQPSRQELREFYQSAEPRLEHEVVWFREEHRDVITKRFEMEISKRGYTPWAFAICRNHAHLLTRVHRDPGEEIWQLLADASRDALRDAGLVSIDHPVWSARPYVVYKTSRKSVENCIDYIEKNPIKEGLSRQSYSWVLPYDGFPRRG